MNAVIFSSFINTQEWLERGKKLISLFEKEFPEEDFYVGINPCIYREQWIDVLQNSKLKIKYGITPPELVINSDASSYQTALNLYREEGKDYDACWFFHTKNVGAEWNIDFFIQRKKYTLDLFSSNERIGSLGHKLYLLCKFPDRSCLADTLTKYYDFPYYPLEYFYEATFYCIKGKILKEFTSKCNESFFNQKLSTVQALNGDRYFFERDFQHIVGRLGYLMSTKMVQIVCDGRYPELNNTNLSEFYINQCREWGSSNSLTLDNEIYSKLIIS